MAQAKIAITLNEQMVARLDELIRERVFSTRSQAIQEAVGEKLRRLEHGRLARECAKLDRSFEQQLAEEGMSGEAASWPEY